MELYNDQTKRSSRRLLLFRLWHRLKGGRVFFMVGTDEHSLNVARQAAAAGKAPALYCAEMAETFKEAYRTLRLSHDRFIRTDEEEHAGP